MKINRRIEDIVFGDEQKDEAKSEVCLNEDEMEGEKLDKEELKQERGTYGDPVNREIYPEGTPDANAPEIVHNNDKWEIKFKNTSDEAFEKIIMAEESFPNKEDVEEKDSAKEQEENSQGKGEAGITLEQAVNGLDTEDPGHKPDGKDKKVLENL